MAEQEQGQEQEQVQDNNTQVSEEITDVYAFMQDFEASFGNTNNADTTNIKGDTPSEKVQEEEEVTDNKEAEEVVEEEDITPDIVEEDPAETEDIKEDVTEHTGEAKEDSDDLDDEQEEEDSTDYKGFFEQLHGKTVIVDGVEVEAITDPSKILKMQSKFMKYSKKADEYDKLKPNLDILKKHGLLGDSAKLTLLLEASEGNQDAIKTLLKNNNIDPYELDMEEIDESTLKTDKYTPDAFAVKFDSFVDKLNSVTTPNNVVNIVENFQVTDTDESLLTLFDSPARVNTLVAHVEDGVYFDTVKAIKAKELQDFTGEFTSKNFYDKYQEVSNTLLQERINELRKEESITTNTNNVQKKAVKPKVKKEVIKPKIEQAREVDTKRKEKAKVASEATISNIGNPPSESKVLLEELEGSEFIDAFEAMFGTN